MTPAALERLRTSYEHLAPRAARMTRRFYDRLFALRPDVRELFGRDLEQHHGHFSAAFALIARNASMLEALEEPLAQLGDEHARRGVRPDDYPAACEALLFALACELGTEWTTELSADWTRFLDRVTRLMLSRHRPTEPQPTGTRH